MPELNQAGALTGARSMLQGDLSFAQSLYGGLTGVAGQITQAFANKRQELENQRNRTLQENLQNRAHRLRRSELDSANVRAVMSQRREQIGDIDAQMQEAFFMGGDVQGLEQERERLVMELDALGDRLLKSSARTEALKKPEPAGGG